MPVYEYRCRACHRRSTQYFRSFAAAEHPLCPHCQSDQLVKLVSRVYTVRSEEARLDSLADPSNLGDIDENDPKSIARMMRKMGSEMGEEMPPELNEMVDRLEAGESPEEIEKSMPDLAGPEGPGGMGGADDGL